MDKASSYDEQQQVECKCSPLSAFLWWNDTSRTIFCSDRSHRPEGENGLSIAQRTAKQVEQQRAAGATPGYLRGVSKNSEAEALRIKDFHVYSKARQEKK